MNNKINANPGKEIFRFKQLFVFPAFRFLQSWFSFDSDFIFVSHAPPYNSGLDIVEGKNVGSLAIRKFIEKHQPLLSLHGHVHEFTGTAKIGKTICVNPGSGHMENLLKAAVIDMSDKIKFVSL